ncbi:hypothetical protein [Marivita sp.]|uniref:hypothetical protein n=1 Tax=Marivita sp. TaxID=2003365 RepID=UPI003F6EAC02
MTGPADVAPVTLDGVRYEALHWGKQRGLGQNGGFVAAYDAESGEELWVERIYEIVYGDKSPQKYDIFIRDLTPIDNGTALRITDGTGRVFRLILSTRDVLLVAEPVTSPTKPSPMKPPPATE